MSQPKSNVPSVINRIDDVTTMSKSKLKEGEEKENGKNKEIEHQNQLRRFRKDY